jgi:hypothetical protein
MCHHICLNSCLGLTLAMADRLEEDDTVRTQFFGTEEFYLDIEIIKSIVIFFSPLSEYQSLHVSCSYVALKPHKGSNHPQR